MPVYPLNREKTWLLPPTLDELIPADHPARFVAVFVDGLEQSFWAEMEVSLDGDPLGAPSYHPRAMLGVWLYGFMTGTRSSRKLEAACRDQMPYLWLTGWQRPDHNSLWRFYRAHRKYMRSIFKRSVRTAVKLGLVDMAVQAVDGTKVVANAAKKRTYTEAQLEELQEKTEAAIIELEALNEAGAELPPAHLPKELADKDRLLGQV
ncbi:MAG: transposase, partial [Chloroflexi bacterium]|nr:transposase [Chloroflexota bacterium]